MTGKLIQDIGDSGHYELIVDGTKAADIINVSPHEGLMKGIDNWKLVPSDESFARGIYGSCGHKNLAEAVEDWDYKWEQSSKKGGD